MSKPIAMGLGFVLSTSLASAQPAPSPAPVPPPGSTPAAAPSSGPARPKKPNKTDEKAGVDESLHHGGDARPWAAGVSVQDQRAALKKFQDANLQLNDGLFASAARAYREALEHWDHPAIHYNLALALLNLDQPIDVYDSLQKAIKYGPAPLEKDKFEHAKEYMLLVEKQIASVEVSCDKPGAKVSVDGKEVFTVKAGEVGRYTGRVRIGRHTFVAEKPGYNAQVDAPFIGPGENFRIELKLYTAEELTRYRRRWDATWIPYAVLGGGVAFGVFGGLMQVSASSSYREYDQAIESCNSANMMGGCADTGAASARELRDSGDTKRMLGYVGYGLAGATLVTGAVMLFLNRDQAYQITADDYKRELRARERAQGKVSITPLVAPGVGGAMVQGRF